VSAGVVTVAVPVLNGGARFVKVLEALARQRVDAAVELLVADSGSSDGSLAVAREHGARVIQIERAAFSHGATRNLLVAQASGSHVALLSQDAEPAREDWLSELLGAFTQAPDVGLAYGPYLPRPDASPLVRDELARWFGSLSPGIDRLESHERNIPAVELMGRRGFFTDANACLARAAWEQIPFREIAYAEDRALALDMLRAGYAKVYEPRAAVYHSHEYRLRQRFQRAFDESRGIREVYGWREPMSPRHLSRQLRGALGMSRRNGLRATELVAVAWDQAARLAGSVLGSRAAALPEWLARACSLEGRAAPAATADARGAGAVGRD
jgi:rhamnosyltransferase